MKKHFTLKIFVSSIFIVLLISAFTTKQPTKSSLYSESTAIVMKDTIKKTTNSTSTDTSSTTKSTDKGCSKSCKKSCAPTLRPDCR